MKLDKLVAIAHVVTAVVVTGALVVLGIRAAIHFDGGWDSLWYHLPFAARRAGMGIPYEMTVRMHHYYEGFPPLPELVQGILWRISGTMNATGVVNYLALLGYLAYCHRVLLVRFWLVALIALTAPLVVMHAACSYIDLFANSFLAVAAASCLYMLLFPDRTTRAVVIGGLIGATGTAYSKIQLIPLAVLFLGLVAVLAVRRSGVIGMTRRRILILASAATLASSLPYVKNFVVYGNPVWPVKAPLIGDALPFAIDAVKEGVTTERPIRLRDVSQPEMFVRSLLEIDYPDADNKNPRWTMDAGRQQAEAGPAFRMGGLWNVNVVLYLLATFALFVLHDRKRGLIAIASSLVVLGIVAVLPQSNELRYYLFLPLTWAAGFAMVFPVLARRLPAVALACLAVMLGMFGYMVSENRWAYRLDGRYESDVVKFYGADQMWPHLRPNLNYCAVGAEPYGLLLTGPTQHEFSIVDRVQGKECPPNTVEIGPNKPPGSALAIQSLELYDDGKFEEAIKVAAQAVIYEPNAAIAWKTECAALCQLARWDEAIPICERAVKFHTNGSAANLARARANRSHGALP